MPDGPPLSRAAFDRAALRRTDPAWLADAWARAAVVFVSPTSATPVVVGPDGTPAPAFHSAANVPPGATRRFLGVVDDTPYFAATVDGDDGDWLSLRELGADADELPTGLLTAAIGLEQWHQRHGFCPRCGSPTVEADAGWIRRCSRDGSDHFPRTDPAVIMLIHDGGDLALLGRGPQWGPGRFSTLAGFVEPGESLEAAVAREVFEEVGVTVTGQTYVASQPWPFPASLMVGFSARLDGDPAIHLDPVEMAEAAWFTREEIRQAAEWADHDVDPEPGVRLRAVSSRLSISRYLIDQWLAGDS